MVYTDPLIKAYNRRFLEEHLYLHHGRNDLAESITIIMMDMHHFKMINDVYGHIEGDRVLKGVAKALKGQMRDSDSLIRYGGDEFVIILTDCKEEQIPSFIDRYREAVSMVRYGPNDSLCAQADFGYAHMQEYSSNMNELEELLQLADDRMYEQKHRAL